MIRHNGIEIDRSRRVITHNGVSRYFRAPSNNPRIYRTGSFELWQHLICGPVSLERVFDLMYSYCPNGGPNAGPNYLRIRMSQMRPHIALLGLKLVREQHPGCLWYRLVPIDVV